MTDAVSFKEYVDVRLNELDRRLSQSITDQNSRAELALSSTKEAVSKAEIAYNERFKLLNEFRGQQADEARKYALIALVDQQFKSLENRVVKNETGLASLQGRALALAGLGAVFGLAIGALFAKLLH